MIDEQTFQILDEAHREEAIFELLLEISRRLDGVETQLERIASDVNDIERDMESDVDVVMTDANLDY